MNESNAGTQSLLAIVPCGRAKIWDTHPDHGPTPARDAYTGPLFRVNRRYAERFSSSWVILSAKYGLILPDFPIPGPYDVTFKKPSTGPVQIATVQLQLRSLGLDRFEVVVGLGGAEYRAMIQQAFASTDALLHFPFAGLTLGKMMQAVNGAIDTGQPGFGGVSQPPPPRPPAPKPGSAPQGPRESVYGPLATHLGGIPLRRITLTFAQIEKILFRPLPSSAYGRAAWWANDSSGHTQARSWLAVGWRVENVDLARQRVTFVRV